MRRIVLVGLALALVACGGSPTGQVGTEPAPSTSSTSSATIAPPSAATGLAPFVAAARQVDARLRAAAVVINDATRSDALHVTQATVDTVHAADPSLAAEAIPAGLDPTLLRPVLLVYSELESRRLAMNQVEVGVFPRSDDRFSRYGWTMLCLANGAEPAARFGPDLAALQELAATSPPIVVAAPDSRAAAELAVRISNINLANAGCGSCGGQLAPQLSDLAWGSTGPALRWSDGTTSPIDGTIAGIGFHVRYHQGVGWAVEIMAC